MQCAKFLCSKHKIGFRAFDFISLYTKNGGHLLRHHYLEIVEVRKIPCFIGWGALVVHFGTQVGTQNGTQDGGRFIQIRCGLSASSP